MKRRDFLKKTGSLITTSLIPLQISAESLDDPLISKIKEIERELYKKTYEISTSRTPGMTAMSSSLIEAKVPNNLKLTALFTDNPSTERSPDDLLAGIYKKTGNKYQLLENIMDNGLDGIIPITSQQNSFVGIDHYAIHSTNEKIKNLIPNLNKKELEKLNKRLLSVLTQILVYSENPNGEITPIKENDIGIQYPNEIPIPGIINWNEPLSGFETSYVDVLFHNKLVDRINILKIDPEKYKLSIHVDKQLKNIETWRDCLDAIAVINGSFYQAQPNYGEPITPIMTQGNRKGPKNYKTKHGAFLFEPINSNNDLVKIIDYKELKIADIENKGYKEGIVSYPTLLDFNGNIRTKNNPTWRANRSFMGMDNSKNIILGNTQSGFFSLYRLGKFLKSLDDLDLAYALNLDGGPPACMAVKAGDYNYINYGVWESNNSSGREIIDWNDQNKSKWEIPIVISVKQR